MHVQLIQQQCEKQLHLGERAVQEVCMAAQHLALQEETVHMLPPRHQCPNHTTLEQKRSSQLWWWNSAAK